MPSPVELKFDPITADWTYIRWLLGRRREANHRCGRGAIQSAL
jgi:hypothetical protein